MPDHPHPVDAHGVEIVCEQVRAVEPGGELLSVLADPLRARIVTGLAAVEELCVGDLALALEASEDAVSYGLRLLRTAGLVRSRKEGRMRFYRLADETTKQALSAVFTSMGELAQRPRPFEGEEG